MIVHIVAWNHKPEYSEAEKTANAARIRRELEALNGVIPEMRKLCVHSELFGGSNADIVLYSEFENEEALRNYQIHPEHEKAAEFVRSVTCSRKCFDYEDKR